MKDSKKTPIEQIYEKYRNQIDAIVQEMDGSYRGAAIVLSWLYGGSSEGWRKLLPTKKSSTMPKEVKNLLKKFKTR